MKKRIPLLVIGVWAVVLIVAALSGLAQVTVNCSGVTAWAAGGSYTVGELVTYQGSEYKCAQANNNAAPNWDPIDWPGGWTLVGTCTSGPTATATATATATKTATATVTATKTATATATATTTATKTATATATATKTATATATKTATATATATGAGCYTPWSSTTAYNGGATVSYNAVNYTAAFWSQGSNPSTNNGAAGSGQPWISDGNCSGGGSTPTPTRTATSTASATRSSTPTPTSTPGNGIIGDCGMDENGAGTGQVDYVEVYSSQYAKWCVDTTYWSANQQYINQFFSYYDGAVAQLISLFNIQPPFPIVVEVTTPTGGACDCGPRFGQQESVIITGDAYSNVLNNPQSGQAVPGFWGYLFTLHETINVFTGSLSGGWPTDWWADHRSPFPNAMDEQVMLKIGQQQGNQTLVNAGNAQHERFADPSQSGYDVQVAMFDNFFTQYGGFPSYSKFFQLVEGDGMAWTSLSSDAYGELLSEYVAAYLSLGLGVTSDLTSTLTNDRVGTMDTTMSPYTLNSSNIRAIGSAHCSIRAAANAGVNTSSALSALRSGNYQSATVSGGTQAGCPSECSWNGSKCVAKW